MKKILKDLEPGDVFWSYTDKDVLEYKVICDSGEKIAGGMLITVKETETGKTVDMLDTVWTYSDRKEALESFLGSIVSKREELLSEKEKLEIKIREYDGVLDKHMSEIDRYPKVGESFYYRVNGHIRKAMCYEIEEYDREGFYDPCFRILKDSWGRGSMVSHEMIIGVL